MENKNRYIDGLNYETPHPFRTDADRLDNWFETKAYVENGIVRWSSNDTIPPQDVLDFWIHIGKNFNKDETLKIKDKEDIEFLNQYKESQKNREYSQEELYEMRAAYGEGTVVTNVITGKKIKL